MKLPFFKTKKVVPNTGTPSKNFQEDFLMNFNSSERAGEQVVINYTFLCDHGRSGDSFSAKLGEDGDEVFYTKTKKGVYQITGTTSQMVANEHLIKEHLAGMVEKGNKFNCTLTEYRVEALQKNSG